MKTTHCIDTVRNKSLNICKKQHVNMKLILFTSTIFVFSCSASPLSSVEDQLQRIQLKVEQLERNSKETISTMKQTYDEKISRLEEQLKSGTNLVSQKGPVYLLYLYSRQIYLSNHFDFTIFSGSSGCFFNPFTWGHEHKRQPSDIRYRGLEHWSWIWWIFRYIKINISLLTMLKFFLFFF